jgi:hypothetical protein
MTETILLCIIGLLLGERAAMGVLFARERRDLYNRLQAGTLTDYTRNAIISEEFTKDTRIVVSQAEKQEDEPVVVESISDQAIADAQGAFNRLMGTSE